MRLIACAIFLLCASCIGRGQDAHEPGDRLGTYHATGALLSDTCQALVLGVTQSWAFDVKLSRQGDTLYWLNGEEAIPGSIAADGRSFDFASGVQVALAPAKGVNPGCTIDRADAARGELSAKDSDVKSFTVDMSFTYAAQSGSQCAGLVGVEGGFAALPCKVSYRLSGKRTALAPAE